MRIQSNYEWLKWHVCELGSKKVVYILGLSILLNTTNIFSALVSPWEIKMFNFFNNEKAE